MTHLNDVRHVTGPDGFPYCVEIGLPWGYDPRRPGGYPVLVALDGVLTFATARDTARAQANLAAETAPIIVVGVTPAVDDAWEGWFLRRIRDFTVVAPPDDIEMGRIVRQLVTAAGLTEEEAFGGADQFLSLLVDTVLPFVTQAFAADPRRIGLFGASLGGSFAVHALLERAPFDRYLLGNFPVQVLGPSFQARTQRLIDQAPTEALPVFFGIGSRELESAELSFTLDNQPWLARLNEHGVIDLTSYTVPEASHSAAFAGMISRGINRLYGLGSAEAIGASIRSHWSLQDA